MKDNLITRHEMGTMIVRLLNSVGYLEDAIERVRELHKPFHFPETPHITNCEACDPRDTWPCDTIRALDGEQE